MTKYSTRNLRALATQALLGASLCMLAACQQGEQGAKTSGPTELDWARAALERNPQIEVIAADSDAQVVTIRDTRSGEVHAVKLGELAAVPVSRLSAGAASSQPNVIEETMPSTGAESREEPAQPTDDSNERQRVAAAPTSEQRSEPEANYTIERSDGQVRVSGPGVSIVSSGAAPASDTAQMGNNAVEPIVCEGRRMVHLDNREIYVDGDAIIVRGGCEMFITNSRIAASGTGVVVQDGTVHLSNSHVEGTESSVDAGSNAKLFVRGSTFRGVSRRAQDAVVQDQGGNRWR
jgi:hypothetical protein